MPEELQLYYYATDPLIEGYEILLPNSKSPEVQIYLQVIIRMVHFLYIMINLKKQERWQELYQNLILKE
jgi:hypothetical protein